MLNGDAQIEERGPTSDDESAIERIDDGERARAVGAEQHARAVDDEPPRLRVVIRRREHRVMKREAQFAASPARGGSDASSRSEASVAMVGCTASSSNGCASMRHGGSRPVGRLDMDQRPPAAHA